MGARRETTIRLDAYHLVGVMTALIRLIFPGFNPAPTVENFGARLKQADRPEDPSERQQWLAATFNQPAKRQG